MFAPDGAGSTADWCAAAVRDHPAAAQRHRLPAPRPRPADHGRGPDDPPRADARAARRCSCPASTTPASPPSSCSTGSSRRKGRAARPSAASATSSGCAAFVAETRQVILTQQRRLGGSCDWGRLRFTMDDGQREGRPRTRSCGCTATDLAYRDGGADQLVPGLPDERQRPRGDPDAGDGHALARPLPPDRRGDGSARPGCDRDRRHDAARDDPRRHRRGGPSRRPALRGARRPPRADPVRRARRAGHRGRRGRPGVRDRRRQDHARPRPRRLRDRPPARPRDADHPRRRGAGWRTPARRTTAWTATRPATRILADLAARGDLAGRAAARDDHRPLPAQRRRRRAAAQDPVVRANEAACRRGARGHPLGRDDDPAASGSRRPGNTG